ncbi:MAG: enoyl-CoA hydratase/isomerase family protein [Sphingomonadaceae bacterium]|nr:enoyl-CoA hydratase/isomerase family protein [Sphingomonadaceae bacterium]
MFRLERDGGEARLILDRPASRNAIPASGWGALGETIDRVAASDARLLVVTGAGGTFCAGADLADFSVMRADPAAIARFREDMRGALDRLGALPIPTIALIHGHCYGAGVALAMACDLRIAAPAAAFAITPAKIGISYPQEDVHRLVALVGTGQAARLLFTAAAIGGEEALRIGLVDLLAPDAVELCEAILAHDKASLAVLKQAIGRAAGGARTDAELDRRFDDLIGGAELSRRLEALRRK